MVNVNSHQTGPNPTSAKIAHREESISAYVRQEWDDAGSGHKVSVCDIRWFSLHISGLQLVYSGRAGISWRSIDRSSVFVWNYKRQRSFDRRAGLLRAPVSSLHRNPCNLWQYPNKNHPFADGSRSQASNLVLANIVH